VRCSRLVNAVNSRFKLRLKLRNAVIAGGGEESEQTVPERVDSRLGRRKQRLLQFRLGSHGLPVVVGRCAPALPVASMLQGLIGYDTDR